MSSQVHESLFCIFDRFISLQLTVKQVHSCHKAMRYILQCSKDGYESQLRWNRGKRHDLSIDAFNEVLPIPSKPYKLVTLFM